ncbi:DUF4132 domain-containing protein [Ktedonobacteria bacterium brp13]|nr:DUF4132 domain-containing protein [Ktedonobacteria bacterium brp13]
MLASENEHIQHVVEKFHQLGKTDDRTKRIMNLELAKMDARLPAELLRFLLKNVPRTVEGMKEWLPYGVTRRVTGLIEIVCDSAFSYTEEDIRSILCTIDELVQQEHAFAVSDLLFYDRYTGCLLNVLNNVFTFLKQEALMETYRPELEKLYRSASIWGNYVPYSTSYQLRWEMDALLSGENTTNLAALVKQYGRDERVSLAEQGAELVRVYHEELGDLSLIQRGRLRDDHPCTQVLLQHIVPPLQIAFVRALLKSEVRIEQDWPFLQAFMTPKQPYTPAAVHDMLRGLFVNNERDSSKFLKNSGATAALLQRFIEIERTQVNNLDRAQIEEDVRYIVYLMSKLAWLRRGETGYIMGGDFFLALNDLLTYIKQIALATICCTELEELRRTAELWDNYHPTDTAYRLHRELDALLFGKDVISLAGLIERYKGGPAMPMAQQASELLHAYHEEVKNISYPDRSHPCIVALCGMPSSIQIALIKALLMKAQSKEEHNKGNSALLEALFTEEQAYTPDDIHDILHACNANFTLHGPDFLQFCVLRPSLLETFERTLQAQDSFNHCRTEFEALYHCFSSHAGYGWDSTENHLRQTLRRILSGTPEGELTLLLHQYTKKVSTLDEKAARAVLTALHLELAGLDLFSSKDSFYNRTPSWEDRSWMNELPPLVGNDLSKLLAKTFASSARTTLVCLALQEAVQFWQKVAEHPSSPDHLLIEIAYLRQDIQLAVTLCQHASYTPDDIQHIVTCLVHLLEFFGARFRNADQQKTQWIFAIVSACKPCIAQTELSAACETALTQLETAIPLPRHYMAKDNTALDRQLKLLLTDLLTDSRPKIDYPLLPDAWGKPVLERVEAMADDERQAWLVLLRHCATSIGSKPTTSWRKKARELVNKIGQESFTQHLREWLRLHDRLEDEPLEESSTSILQGLIWCCADFDDRVVCLALVDTAILGYRQRPQSPRVANACVSVLGTMPGMYAIGQLERVRYSVKHASFQEHIQTTIEEVAQREGLSPLDVQELAIYDFELQDGFLRRTFGPYTAQIAVTTQGVQLQWYDQEQQLLARRPAEIKRTYGQEWRAFDTLQKNLEKVFVIQRRRIERLPLSQQSWSAATWQERYFQHPLIRILARNLIWQIRMPEKSETVIWYQGHFVNSADQPVEIPGEAEVQIWHPLLGSRQDVQRWQIWVEQHRVIQPFKQAHREIYRLEDEEKESATLRFAGHYLHQYQFSLLARARGWQYTTVAPGQETWVILPLPYWKCRAEFEVKADESGRRTTASYTEGYEEILTGELSFQVEDEGEAEKSAEMRFKEVPPLVLSEVMRDLDLFVSVTSIARDREDDDEVEESEDPLVRYMRRYGFGELSSSAYERKQFLQRLVPGLTIAERCSFQGHFVQVRGDLFTYKIHLGSANIVVEPENHYLPMQAIWQADTSSGGKYFLPFEGDTIISEILSKMFVLANDTAPKMIQLLKETQFLKEPNGAANTSVKYLFP